MFSMPECTTNRCNSLSGVVLKDSEIFSFIVFKVRSKFPPLLNSISSNAKGKGLNSLVKSTSTLKDFERLPNKSSQEFTPLEIARFIPLPIKKALSPIFFAITNSHSWNSDLPPYSISPLLLSPLPAHSSTWATTSLARRSGVGFVFVANLVS